MTDVLNCVFSQPKRDITGFRGCSCAVCPEHKFTAKLFLHSFQMASVQNMTASNFAAEMRRFRAGAVDGPNNRIALSFRLTSREPVPENTWIIDHNAAGFPGNVTIAVCGANGLQAMLRNFTFQNVQHDLGAHTFYVCLRMSS